MADDTRRLSEEDIFGQQRPETGPMQFGDDWPGVFIRGDGAMNYAMHLASLLEKYKEQKEPEPLPISLLITEGLQKTLSGAKADELEPREIQHLAPWGECQAVDDADRVAQVARELLSTETVRVRIAVATWYDPDKEQWQTYCEGWNVSAPSDPKDDGAAYSVFENDLNKGAVVYWRWIEADVPIPILHEPVVEGKEVPCTTCNGKQFRQPEIGEKLPNGKQVRSAWPLSSPMFGSIGWAASSEGPVEGSSELGEFGDHFRCPDCYTPPPE